jgi:hypothetical protein
MLNMNNYFGALGNKMLQLFFFLLVILTTNIYSGTNYVCVFPTINKMKSDYFFKNNFIDLPVELDFRYDWRLYYNIEAYSTFEFSEHLRCAVGIYWDKRKSPVRLPVNAIIETTQIVPTPPPIIIFNPKISVFGPPQPHDTITFKFDYINYYYNRLKIPFLISYKIFDIYLIVGPEFGVCLSKNPETFYKNRKIELNLLDYSMRYMAQYIYKNKYIIGFYFDHNLNSEFKKAEYEITTHYYKTGIILGYQQKLFCF